MAHVNKIMIFIRGYLPGKEYGGPTTSIYNLTELLGEEYDIKIVCQNHDLKSNKPYNTVHAGWNDVGKAKVFYLDETQKNTGFITELIKEFSPSLIYASSVMEIRYNASVFRSAKKLGIPVVLVPRGELCDWALNLKAWKKRPYLWYMKLIGYFDGFYFQSTIDEETGNIKRYLGTSPERIFHISNIPMVPIERTSYRKESGKLKLLFVSRIHKKKNLPFAIKAVNQMKMPVQFDIYGSIEDQGTWEEAKREIEKSPEHVKINYRGQLDPYEARTVYQKYDCFLFPTLSENYGHVIAESLANNVPVVISKGTTPWDDLDGRAGYTVSLSSADLFAEKLDEVSLMEGEYKELLKKTHAYVLEKMDMNEIKKQYVNMFEKVTN